MNIINFSAKKNLINNSINKYVAFLSSDTYVSADSIKLYTNYNELEKDYPYNKYLSTMEELLNRGISILMIPLSFTTNTRSYIAERFYNYEFRSKTYNAPITLVVTKYLTYYRYTITSRNYTEEFYVTYDESASTDEIILYSDIGDYSELICCEELSPNTALPLPTGIYESTIMNETIFSSSSITTMMESSIRSIIDTDWYPDFIIIDYDYYRQINLRDSSLFDNLLKDQFSQLIVMTSPNTPIHNIYSKITENRLILLNDSTYFYDNNSMTLLVPYLDMILNRGNYQEYVSNLSRYDVSNNSNFKTINGLNYDSVSRYYINGIVDANDDESYFIIRYYISRLSRLLSRNPAYLRGAPDYIRIRFLDNIINQLLIYNNISDIVISNYTANGNKLDISVTMTVNYLINKTINFNVTFNIA